MSSKLTHAEIAEEREHDLSGLKLTVKGIALPLHSIIDISEDVVLTEKRSDEPLVEMLHAKVFYELDQLKKERILSAI